MLDDPIKIIEENKLL